MDITERELIRMFARIFNSPPPPVGIGDDCAVLSSPGRVLLSTDLMFGRTHFPAFLSYRERGYMAAAANISDIAAMGGRPVALLVSLGLPRNLSLGEMRDIANGIKECASHYGLEIIGGDTKASGDLTICITAIGFPGRRLLTRDVARPGEVLAVTGSLGGQLADMLKQRKRHRIGRPFVPEPRVREGIVLSSSHSSGAAIDITDGVGASALLIAEASGVRIEIDSDALPISHHLLEVEEEDRCRELVLGWGGDYELLFTAQSSGAVEKLARRADCHMTVIGRVERGNGVYVRRKGKLQRYRDRGYDTFSTSRRVR
ncbi:MAG: thiamine-phosphate kinase [Methanomassiliicoccales archaeon]